MPAAARLAVIRAEIQAPNLALDALVEAAARGGATGEAIAAALGISRPTLYRRHGRALASARGRK